MTSHNKSPEPASTLIIGREHHGQIEVFMVVRHKKIDFASGALVFPGGKVEAQDSDPELSPYLDGASSKPEERALQVAGIRETFEECGVLLARDQNTSRIITKDRLKEVTPYRKSLHNGDLDLKSFLRQENLLLACDQLVQFANWVTPTFKERRFDTHFFLVKAPHDHFAEHDGIESVDSVWITPEEALADAQSGKRLILFPTLCNLDRIGKYASLDIAIADAADHPVVPISPWIEQQGDGRYLCIPENLGYSITKEKITRPL